MTIVLFRVDERLIHGQVVVGWGSHLQPDRIVVVDDQLAESVWEQELYCLGLPPGVESEFVTVAVARGAVAEWRSDDGRAILLTRDIDTMRRLAAGGTLRDADINIGGIHHAPGRRQVLPYVYLSATEESALEQLGSEVGAVSARDLPGARAVDLPQLLGDGRRA